MLDGTLRLEAKRLELCIEPVDVNRLAREAAEAGYEVFVVTDASGREVRRATPGIQGPDQVRGLVAL